jgi:hypothetical protein
MSAESGANIIAWITGMAEKTAGVTRTDIRNCCRQVCNIEVTHGWVDSLASRHSAELIEKKGLPSEAPRLHVP